MPSNTGVFTMSPIQTQFVRLQKLCSEKNAWFGKKRRLEKKTWLGLFVQVANRIGC
jgi:hypothetical protein